ncbi:hypothetical protein [Kurthia huakuii]|uniref:hypothetical protein n=1 Tax=Kurthia huakuii TaxID=1421019 RepID=UPI000497AD97|nr:hypothetical protein [Kurthia huakuii]MBM7700943.1 hypothetical protein [Kurthia huakuii]
MIKNIKETSVSRKQKRMMLIGLSMIPNPFQQLKFKLQLQLMDTEDYNSGRISKNIYRMKSTLRFIPIGGLLTSAYDALTEGVLEESVFSMEDLKSMNDEELKLVYNEFKKITD